METNFAELTPVQKLNWARETWSAARDQMFLNRFMGKGDNNVVQRITELTKTEKGEQCIFQLVADLVGDGVIGDNEREGNEESMQSYSQIITLDQISHGVKNKGKMADQRTVINFREKGRDNSLAALPGVAGALPAVVKTGGAISSGMSAASRLLNAGVAIGGSAPAPAVASSPTSPFSPRPAAGAGRGAINPAAVDPNAASKGMRSRALRQKLRSRRPSKRRPTPGRMLAALPWARAWVSWLEPLAWKVS